MIVAEKLTVPIPYAVAIERSHALSQVNSRVPVTVLAVTGEVDARTSVRLARDLQRSASLSVR